MANGILNNGVQVQWLNAGNVFGLGHDKDFILGDPQATSKMTIQGKPPFFLTPAGPDPAVAPKPASALDGARGKSLDGARDK